MNCNYCDKPTVYIDSQVIYGTSYGYVYYCEPCSAWVGVHKGTDKPLGRLANGELREWKKKAHATFDPLWKRKVIKDGIGKGKARRKGYKWLADSMGIGVKDCHIGMFDVDQCKQVVGICSPYLTTNH